MRHAKLIGLCVTLLTMAVSIVSCDKDVEGTPYATYNYRLAINPTLLRIADIKVTTLTAEGTEVETTLNDTIYQYICEVSNFPATIKASITYDWKSDLDTTTSNKVDLYINSTYTIATYDEEGRRIKEQTRGGASITNRGVKGTDLYKVRESHLKTLIRTSYAVTFKQEGNTVDFTFE